MCYSSGSTLYSENGADFGAAFSPDFEAYLFFFNDTATTEIYTLSLHDALPLFMDEMPGAGDRVHGERAQRVGQLDQLGRPRSAAVGHAAQHQQHGTRDRRETRLEPLPLARRGHGKVAPQRAVEVARGAGRVAVHHAVTDPRRIGRQGDQVCADLLADHADASEQLDPGRELHRP